MSVEEINQMFERPLVLLAGLLEPSEDVERNQ